VYFPDPETCATWRTSLIAAEWACDTTRRYWQAFVRAGMLSTSPSIVRIWREPRRSRYSSAKPAVLAAVRHSGGSQLPAPATWQVVRARVAAGQPWPLPGPTHRAFC
jgi:hypothetical protein